MDNSIYFYILYETNEKNILNVLDNEFRNYIFNYDTKISYIVSNMMALRYEAKINEKKNKNISYKINNFLLKNLNEFRNLNENIILKSPYFEKQILKLKNNNIKEIIEEGVEICFKCKSKKIKIIYKQVRSGDEGETGFFECTECKNKWTK